MEKTVAILQSNYVPWKGYFDLINSVDTFIFYDIVKYTKNDWRNRNIIYTKNGIQWLTIPIDSSAVNFKINEVKINNDKWQELHFKSLFLGYKRAPYFFQLEELMNDYLKEKKWNRISELNQYLIVKISRLLGIKTEFKNAEEFEISGDRIDRLLKILNQSKASRYISGPSAQSYLKGNEYLFDDLKIQLQYFKYPKYKEYKQLSSPFENYVSILDLIANIKIEEIPSFIWE